MVDTASDISRRINAERVLIIAWLRAILLQLAHPLIAAGVAEYSTFRGSTKAAVFRLHQTINAMLAISFGGDPERTAALDGIRAIHRRVHGTLPIACGPFAAGTRYSAEDPELLLWVHVTLVESVLLGYQQLVGPLTAAERDQYCAESAEVAVALGARTEAVPRAWDALRGTVERGCASETIVVSEQARTLAAALLTPFGGWFGRSAISPILSLLAAGQLPSTVRSQYGFAWNSTRGWRFMRVMALLRAIRRRTPRPIAWWPAARGRRIACLAGAHGYTAATR
jgi:uncharacterized protein (DUF2236 family)